MYHELTGLDLAGRAFRFEVSFKVRQGSNDKHREINFPQHFPLATPKINARQAPISMMAAKITE